MTTDTTPCIATLSGKLAHRFERTYCSQCGGKFGPGNSGFSHCTDHSPIGCTDDRERMRALIADDVYAATFQSLGQYRSALLRALKA